MSVASLFRTFFMALTIVFVVAGWGQSTARAQSETPPVDLKKPAECASCHSEIYAGWHTGAHSETETEVVLTQAMNCLACHKEIANNGAEENKEGMPKDCLSCHSTGYNAKTGKRKSDGIPCEACHETILSDHPKTAVTVDKSATLCRQCHTADRFNWDKWEESAHYQNSMACINCHNPHTTSLKIVDRSSKSASRLCENCHKDLAQSLEHSTHAEININCADCHLGEKKGADDFHQTPDHDFKPKIEACNRCHKNQMHTPGEPAINISSRLSSEDQAELTPTPVATLLSPTTPRQTHPGSFGFIGVATLFGLFAGVVWRRSLTK